MTPARGGKLKASTKKTISKVTKTTRSKTTTTAKIAKNGTGTLHAFKSLKSGKSAGTLLKDSKDGKLQKALGLKAVDITIEVREEQTPEEAVVGRDPAPVTASTRSETKAEIPTRTPAQVTHANTSTPRKRKRRDEDDDEEDALGFETAPNGESGAGGETSHKRTRIDTDQCTPQALTLPQQLTTLVSIHSHLLTNLLLHYSTSGLVSPAILRALLPQLSKAARKEISTEDLRRIATLSNDILVVVQTEQGLGIELVGKGILGRMDSLRSEFADHVREWWKSNPKLQSKDTDILSHIPLSEIKLPAVNTGSTLTPTANGKQSKPKNLLLAKGQRRLDEFRAFAATKAASITAKTSTNQKENAPPQSRQSSLLDRIRLKAAATLAAAPNAPSKEVLERTSALQSLENIIPVLLQLTQKSATATTSFPLTTIVQHVKNSFKNPIAGDEVERALRVLSTEVAVGWCRMVDLGKEAGKKGVTGVVFERRGKAEVEGWKWKEGM